MFSSFQDFWRIHKPILDEAFRRQISDLLENISLQQMPALMATLEAGKKIRGCLACLITNALGGELDSAIPRAVAIELIQAATLIHDDFVDQDTIRGNRPAAWTLEGARRAVLIGEKTFGKGSVQAPIELSNGGELRVTVARWFTPNDRAIHGEGLEPDVAVELTQEDFDAERDPQLDRAVEYLLGGQ